MNDMKEKAMGAVKAFLERKGYEIVDEAWQGPEGIGGIDLVAVDEDGILVFVDATVRIGTDGFPEAHRARELREALAATWLAGNSDDYADTPVRFDELGRVVLDVVAVEHGDRLDGPKVDEHAEGKVGGQTPEARGARASAFGEGYAHVVQPFVRGHCGDVVGAQQAYLGERGDLLLLLALVDAGNDVLPADARLRRLLLEFPESLRCRARTQ